MARREEPVEPDGLTRTELLVALKVIASVVAIPLAVLGVVALFGGDVGWPWWILAVPIAAAFILVLLHRGVLDWRDWRGEGSLPGAGDGDGGD